MSSTIVANFNVILSLSKDGPGSRVARYATTAAGAGIISAGPSFDRLRMTRNIGSLTTRNIGLLMTRHIRSLTTRHIGLLMTRNIGSLMTRNIGSLMTRNIGLLMTRNIGLLVTRTICTVGEDADVRLENGA